MKKFKTSDNYHVYRIKKEKQFFFLADQFNYKKEITQLTDTLEDLKYDSLVLLFGIDTGEYIEDLKKSVCGGNKVFIIEPNKAIYEKYTPNITDNIKLIPFNKIEIKKLLNNTIYFRNINNIYFYAFGNYSTIYKKEYDYIISNLDWSLINASSYISLAKRFKKIFIQNLIANINILHESTPIGNYMFTNLNVPAIIVSGGPSLEQNIKDMLLYKEKLKKCFIITGSRTVKALIENDIMPDLIVSIDPIDANYDMMKDYLDLKVPLVFYEYSNRYLLKKYKGNKIYIAHVLPKTMDSLSHLKDIYSGGSVAHTCIDIANMLGCSPILFTGQDLAYTYNKHHAAIAIHDYDKTLHYKAPIQTKDVYGNLVNTTVTLEHYKKRLEEYMASYKKYKRIKFINCSYGAEIKGAPHKELTEILNQNIYHNQKRRCIPAPLLEINNQEIITDILNFINENITNASHGLDLCETIIRENKSKSLINVEDNDIDLQRILYIIQIINNFEASSKTNYLGGYYCSFLFEMKDKIFCMPAKDYDHLTSDLQYQTKTFKIYFEKMMELLKETRDIVLETVKEFYI